MYPPCPTPAVAGRTIDPILAAYLLVACLPMAMAVLACGLKYLLPSDDPEGRRPRPTRPRRCAGCGYDVRSTPDGAAVFSRCPECGADVEPEPGAP